MSAAPVVKAGTTLESDSEDLFDLKRTREVPIMGRKSTCAAARRSPRAAQWQVRDVHKVDVASLDNHQLYASREQLADALSGYLTKPQRIVFQLHDSDLSIGACASVGRGHPAAGWKRAFLDATHATGDDLKIII
jgi:hypothetical protein